MRILVLLALVVCGALATISREDAITCALRYVDVNPRDGLITAEEIDEAKLRYMKAFMKLGGKYIEPAAKIVQNCDADHDGKISLLDMQTMTQTCLAETWKLNLFGNFFCATAKKREREEMSLALPQ